MVKNTPSLLPVIIGTGFGSGFWPWGPGTAGAVLATVLWLLLSAVLPCGLLTLTTIVLIVVFTAAGTWAMRQLMPFWGDDPNRVVVDEMVGVWVALLPVAAGWHGALSGWHGACPYIGGAGCGEGIPYIPALLALLLFRFFDIVKPLGIRALDRRRGAFWVMADDLLAGVYSAIIILLI